MTGSPFRKLRVILEMIKFEHTIFALPFALISMLVAAHTLHPDRPGIHIAPYQLLWILVAMVGARSAAMTFNRIADARIDAENPRTASRAIPKGLVSIGSAWVFTIVSAALLVLAAYMLNPLAFALSPVALAVVLSYSYAKRFTSFSHLWLGLCLGIAPVGAWIAITGKIEFPSLVLSAAVMLWTAGFDIIYSLQDLDFDRRFGLFSLPARIGAARALLVSRLLHVCMIGLLVWFGMLTGMGRVYYIGIVHVTALLIFEQRMVSAKNLSRINAAFFTMNGFVSIALLTFVVLSFYL